MHLIRTSRKILAILIAMAATALGAVAVPASANADTPVGDSAVAWAQAQAGSTAWDGLCLQFVGDAYSQAGIDLHGQASDTSSAVSFWDTYSGAKYPPSDAPPKGALVFWGATDSNPYGHVAISDGNGMALSSEERSYSGVHELTIAYRNQQGYTELGYVIPG
jgi:cell wall-associated NlpC family hydrolase